jgi:hypothetical protein
MVNGKVHPRRGHEGPEGEYRYSSTLSLTSALDGVDGQRHASAALSPGLNRYPSYRRLDRPQGRSGRLRKISLLTGFDPRTVQPVVSRYTDWATLTHTVRCYNIMYGETQTKNSRGLRCSGKLHSLGWLKERTPRPYVGGRLNTATDHSFLIRVSTPSVT